MISFTQYLAEESAFSKVRKRPYRILGKFEPTEHSKETIGKEFRSFLKSKGYDAHDGDPDTFIRSPREHAFLSKDAVEYHRDKTNLPEKDFKFTQKAVTDGAFLASWSNKTPTRIRTSKTKYSAGKLVGGDIKPNDVVVIYNRRAHHSIPPASKHKDRYFAGMFLKKNKKLMESMFKKIREKPYHILGQFNPSSKDTDTIHTEFHEFLKSKGMKPHYKNHDFHLTVRNPKQNTELLSTEKEGTENFPEERWHQDLTFAGAKHRPSGHGMTPMSQFVVWASEHPTDIKTLDNKPVGHDIKPNDAVLVYNRRAKHQIPDFPDNNNRWFARAIAKRAKVKK